MTTRKYILAVIVIFVLALGVIAAMAFGKGSTGSSPGGMAFSGTTLSGQEFDLSAYRGRPVVVNFWASWCGWCAKEMPDLVRFAAAHPEVAVVGVDVNDQVPAAQQFAAQYGLTFPLVADEDGQIFGRFDSQGLPTTVFFDKNLGVVDKIVGATDMAGFEAGLQKAQ